MRSEQARSRGGNYGSFVDGLDSAELVRGWRGEMGPIGEELRMARNSGVTEFVVN